MTLDRAEVAILRGEQAQRLLDDPILADAFATIEQEYIEQWQNSPARDAEGREKLYMMLKLLQRVKGHLSQVVDTGKLEKATLVQRAGQTLKRVFSQ